MKTARKIAINYFTKAAYELASSLPCPESANDVYNLGVSLQYCIRAKYLELAGQCYDQDYLIEQATRQLAIKKDIEAQANLGLNILLAQFYDQGGPLMAPSVSQKMSREYYPFFKRIMGRLLESLDELTYEVMDGNLRVEELPDRVELELIQTYNAMKKLFPVREIEKAYTDLIVIVRS
jgi:hypothetical protein